MLILISYTVHKQLCWYANAMCIVFTFLYAVPYHRYHPLDFLKSKEFIVKWTGVLVLRRRVLHGGYLLALFLNCLFRKLIQTAFTILCSAKFL